MSKTAPSCFGGVLLTVVDRRKLLGPGEGRRAPGCLTTCARRRALRQLLTGALPLRCRGDHAPGDQHSCEKAEYERRAETLTKE